MGNLLLRLCTLIVNKSYSVFLLILETVEKRFTILNAISKLDVSNYVEAFLASIAAVHSNVFLCC
jgi:hypothetical protein